MKIRLSHLLFIFIFAACVSNIPRHSTAALWAKSYSDGIEYYLSMQITSDGGCVVSGTTYGKQYWILKLDVTGTISWQKAYGDSGTWQYAHSIQQTIDGGYILAGEATPDQSWGNRGLWILKLDTFGSVSWQKTYAILGEGCANAIQQTNDGGYIVAGVDEGTSWIILKLDAHGNVIWQKAYTDTPFLTFGAAAASIQQTADGGYVVAGLGGRYFSDTLLILKLDEAGSISWQKNFNVEMVNSSPSIQQTTDGGYVAALTHTTMPDRGVWIVKLDAIGNAIWQKNYGDAFVSWISSIQQTADGGYVLAGHYEVNLFDRYLWVMKLDSSGTVSWRKSYGAVGSYYSSVQERADGGYMIASACCWISKVDDEGDIPGADFITEVPVGVTDTFFTTLDTAVIDQDSAVEIANTAAVPENTTAQVARVQAYVSDWVPLASPTSEDLNGVWGITETRFYAVGNSGTVLDYDGTDWDEQYLGTTTNFNGIWGTSTSDVFIVGDSGTIYHYGTIWTTQTSGTSNNLNGIWGSTSSNVFAVGDGGTIRQNTGGTTWAWVSSPTTENLNGIWGYDANNIYAVGDSGTIIKYNGIYWSTITNPATENLHAIWGTDNGTATHIYAVGDSGTILHTTNGTTWTLVDVPTVSNLNGIWGSKPSNIFVVGDEGTILYYGGTHWIEMDSGIIDDLRCPFGIANPHVFVVGFAGYIGLLQGPYLYGTICDSCTGTPLTGITVTWDNGPPTGGSFTTTKEVYDKFGIGGGYHILSFSKTSYQTAGDTLVLPPNKIDVDHRTYLMPTTYSQYNGCVSGVVAKDILIDGSYPDGVVTKGVREPRINVKLYKPGGCGDVEVENVYTNQNGHFHFPTITKPGIYTLRMLNPDPQHCEVKTYNPATHQLQAQDSFSFVVPQLTPARYDFKLECEEGLVE